jgi:hypothetical protein
VPICGPYLAKFASSQVSAYDGTFTIMLLILVAAFVVACFLRGSYLSKARVLEEESEELGTKIGADQVP